MERFYKNNGKRFWLTLVISLVSMMSFATTYYVSSSAGNDANNGTSSSTPWKTLSKVNSTALLPGDFVLFKCGDSWFGQLIPKSGSSSGVITYGSYGTGVKPLLHQSVNLNSNSNWVNESGNIWRNVYQVGGELITNSSFDLDVTSGWTLGVSGNAVATKLRNTTNYFSSTASMEINVVNQGTGIMDIVLYSNSMSFQAGKYYELTFYAKATSQFKHGQCIWPTGAISLPQYFDGYTINTTWTKYTIPFYCGNNTSSKIGFWIGGSTGVPNGGSFYIDNVSMKEISNYLTPDVGNVIYNNDQYAGARKWSKSSLNSQGDFYFDKTNSNIYIYSNGNPASNYSEIKCCLANPIINNANKSYITIQDLSIKYGGSAGVGYGENSSFQVYKNLDVAWIGGTQFANSEIRAGNGIGFYDNSHDNLVENCHIWEVYDAALSNQSITVLCSEYNIVYRNNIIWNCEYSFEYFSNNSQSTVYNIQFINNTCYNAGGGWSHSQRPDPSGYHLRLAGTPITTKDFTIKNNIFDSSIEETHHNWTSNYSLYNIDYNCYKQSVGNIVGIAYSKYFTLSQSSLYQSLTNWDKNSVFVYDSKFSNCLTKDFSLLSNSACIDAGDPTSPKDPDGSRADIGAIYYNHPKVTLYSTEYKSICDGSSYNGWTTAGTYERTLVAKSGADSIVTTNLTVNPKYTTTENITINQGENYNGWTTTGTYSRKLSSVKGCDSIVTTNLTVAEIILKQGDLAPTHFKAVWLGQNGLNHMNIVVVSALIENVPLSVDDEIAVFSNSLCVGAGRLISSISTSDNTSYLTIRASQNDGTNNGFTDNDTIVFKIWDSKNQKELSINKVTYKSDVATWKTNGKFAANSTAVAEIENYKVYTQNIDLQKGYNMVSTYLTAQNPNAATLTKSLIDDGNLIKLQDETGNSLENWGDFGGWVNKVGTIEETEGYKVQVANNCTLQVTGRPIAMPLDIYLKAGWNIISYPKTELVNAMTVVQSLIDQNKLIKVQDEAGNSIENWGLFGGWKNGIGNFVPGKAYKVKMSSDGILTFQESYTKSVLVTLNTVSTEHFSPAFEGNGTDHMNLNISGLNNSQMSVGDELAAFDGNICVGAVKITSDDITTNTVSLVTSYTTDDKIQNGFRVGDQIKIIAWSKETNNESNVNIEVVSGQTTFEKNATSFVNLKSITTSTSPSLDNNLGDDLKIEMYPNPCQGKFSIRYSELPDQNSRVEVTDISGRKIMTRIITDTLEEFEMENYTAGLYFVKSVIGSKEIVQKLIVNK